jgi:polysaccharide export outer membrane protein
MRSLSVTILAALLLGLPPAAGAQQPPPAPEAAAPQDPLPPGVPLSLPTPAADAYYRLQPTDTLLVRYRYTPEYDATVAVRPDGFITLPIVGEVKVNGLTVAEAYQEVLTQASKRLRNPEMTIELKDFQKPRFVVGGEVDKPGQFELRGRVSLLEALAMAGGLKNSAKHSEVVLFRRFNDTHAFTRVINAKELAKPGHADENPDLRAGDFIFVPQNKISKIERLIPFTSIGWLFTGLWLQ